jgi:hypothetical protein
VPVGCLWQEQIEQLRLDKVELENQLEQESERIVNRLHKEKQQLVAQAARLKQELSKVRVGWCVLVG